MQNYYNGKITIYHLLEGAKQAKGLAFIIDVFRAFSLECYLYSMGAKAVRPIGSLDEAYELKRKHPNYILAGERKGKRCEGFDYGNYPCSIDADNVKGKVVIHTTSSGTQGIVNAEKATTILTGSLVNARAIAEYIIKENPHEVSLVCMGGNGGIEPAVEDELCAEYIRSIYLGEELTDIEQRILNMKDHGAEKFFTPEKQDIFPEQDFWFCTMRDRFNFILKVEQDEIGFVSKKIEVM